jgi:hypothetical protein
MSWEFSLAIQKLCRLSFLELISKMIFDQNQHTSQLNESELILQETIITNQNVAVVLQPGKQALHLPASSKAT